ncbi:MAG: hypothetical protein IPO47_15415 [Bacteroidetes bacterium]|nr:hypothetical protein [Bacteroidota bacterium]
MTLIINIILPDKIIIAADQLKRDGNPDTQRLGESSFVNKLIVAENYVIGPQGSVRTANGNYLQMLHDFTRDNPNLPPDQLIERILELFSDVPNDQRAIEFNLTISGFYEGSLFSHLLNIKTGNSKNLKAETENLVFNGSITGTEITHQALISMNRFLRARRENEIENLEEMVEFEERFLIHSLKNLYMQFRVNTDARFEMIGGGMDYCVITKNSITANIIDHSTVNYFTLISGDEYQHRDAFYQDFQLRDRRLSIGWGYDDPFNYDGEEELFQLIWNEHNRPDDTEHNARNGARSLELFKRLKPGDIIFVRGDGQLVDIVQVVQFPEFDTTLDHRQGYYMSVRFEQLRPGSQIFYPVSQMPPDLRQEFVFDEGRSRVFKEIPLAIASQILENVTNRI